MTTEAKVGSFMIVALALLVYVIMHLGGFSFGAEKGYPVQAVFHQVSGLRSGNLVRYAGVQVGKVVTVEAEASGARAHLLIDEGVDIPTDAVFRIGSDGLMGEKFVLISPVEGGTLDVLRPGAVVQGFDEQGFEQLMVSANATLLDVQKLVQSLQAIFGDERMRGALVDSAVNAREMTENLNRLSAVLARMAADNEQDVRTMVAQLGAMARSMSETADHVGQMVAALDNGGRTAVEAREMIAHLNATSQRVERMAAALEGVVADPETAENLKETLRNAKNASEKADRLLSGGFRTEASAELLYSGGADHYMANADFRLYTAPQRFLLLGVNDIGEGNKANVQLGSTSGAFTGRAGLVDNKAGVGLDARLGQPWTVSVDAYDPNDFQLKLRAQYEFAEDTFLVGQINRANKSEARESFVGVRHSF